MPGGRTAYNECAQVRNVVTTYLEPKYISVAAVAHFLTMKGMFGILLPKNVTLI
jgi:hypothetical protein